MRRFIGAAFMAGTFLWSGVLGSADGLDLLQAAKQGNREQVRTLLASGADVKAQQADGTTALHWAVSRSDVALTDLLLHAGADTNAATDLGVTPLALACENGDAAAVQMLLGAGADPNRKFAKRPPVLMLCARSGTAAGVGALLEHGADVNAVEPRRGQTALMWAAANNHADVVRLLLQHKADVNARSGLERVMVNRADPNDAQTAVIGEVSRGRSTALLLAASHGSVDSARFLLDAGAPVNDIAPDGSSALLVAVHSGHRAFANLLLDHGANPNLIGAGYTALHAAVLRGDLDLVKSLLTHGARVDAILQHGTPTVRAGSGFVLPENLAGATPLLLAARFLEIDILKLLLARGANPRSMLNDGTTPLMLAAGLLSQGPLFDRRGRITVLRTADELAALDVVKLALDRGADPNAANDRGETALHGAAARGYPSIVRLLVDRGARTTAKTSDGRTPFDVADSAVKDLLGGVNR
jgi:uncharacterized protein